MRLQIRVCVCVCVCVCACVCVCVCVCAGDGKVRGSHIAAEFVAGAEQDNTDTGVQYMYK